MNSLVLEAANTTLDLKGESLLLKNFYPSVQKAFSSITNRNKMLRYIFTYIDKTVKFYLRVVYTINYILKRQIRIFHYYTLIIKWMTY
jgi:hypothetical protein